MYIHYTYQNSDTAILKQILSERLDLLQQKKKISQGCLSLLEFPKDAYPY